MKNEKEAPKVILNNSAKYFTEDNFDCVKIAGTYSPVFIQLDADASLRSTNFQVLQPDKTLAYHIEKDAFGEKKAFLGTGYYITVEKGTTGYDFEEKVFVVTVTPDACDFVIDIVESQNKALNDELMAIVCTEKRSSLKDNFNVSIINRNLSKESDTKKGVFDYTKHLEQKFHTLQTTRFLDIDVLDEAHKYLYIDDRKESSFNRISAYDSTLSEFFFNESNLSVQMRGGNFTPYTPGYFDGKSPGEIGILKLNTDDSYSFRRQKEFVILEPVELLHDIDAHIWLKSRVMYRYPQDEALIAEKYPRLIKEAKEIRDYWRDVSPMDEQPKPFVMGAKELYVPCENVRDIWCMRNSPFHFCDRPGVSVRFGKENVMQCDEGKYGVFFVKYEGEEYFARYLKEGKKRFGKDVYNHYTFYDFLPLPDLLANPHKDYETQILMFTYQFEVVRNGLTSVPIDEDTFNTFDIAKREEPNRENVKCPLM